MMVEKCNEQKYFINPFISYEKGFRYHSDIPKLIMNFSFMDRVFSHLMIIFDNLNDHIIQKHCFFENPVGVNKRPY